jgi:hypothetical protein
MVSLPGFFLFYTLIGRLRGALDPLLIFPLPLAREGGRGIGSFIKFNITLKVTPNLRA